MRPLSTVTLALLTLAPAALTAQGAVDSTPQTSAELTATSDTVKRLARQSGLSIKYDKIEDRISIRGDEWEVKSGAFSGPTVRMRLMCLGDGAMLAPARTRCALEFRASSAIDWAFNGEPEVTLLADDSVRMRLGSSHETDFSASGGIRSQWVVVALPLENVAQLAGAREVLGKIGRHQFKLNGQHLKEMRGLHAILTLAGQGD